jgi:hypothetical protein
MTPTPQDQEALAERVSELDLEALKKVAEAATQGDWGMSGARGQLDGHSVHHIYAGERQETIAAVFFNKLTGEGFSDAKFIGACKPATIRALLARAEALEAENERLRGDVQAYSEAGRNDTLLDARILKDAKTRANALEFAFAILAACAEELKANGNENALLAYNNQFRAEAAEARNRELEAELARPRGSQDFHIGQPVEISPSYKHADDWRGQHLWVAGVTAYTGAVFYDVSEHWPPTHLGDITSDFKAEDLIPRQALSTIKKEAGNA